MRPLQRKLLMFLTASFAALLLPTAPALAGGLAPPEPNSFTVESVTRFGACLPNDTSQGERFFASVLIKHEMGKTIQVAATTETVEGVEIAYVGDKIVVDSEEELVAMMLTAVLKPEWQGVLLIGPWTQASFSFYENGFNVGSAQRLFDLCSKNPASFATGVTITTAQAGKPVLVNVLAHSSDPDGDHLEVIGVSQAKVVKGYSNDPKNGRVFIEDNQIRYTPPQETQDYEVAIPYFMSDGKGDWDEAFVLVEVQSSSPTESIGENEREGEPETPIYSREEVIREVENNTTIDYYPVFSKKATTRVPYPYAVVVSGKADVRRRLARVTVTCFRANGCSGRLNMELGNKTAGRANFAFSQGRHTVWVKLTKSALKRLSRARRHRLSVVASAPFAQRTVLTLEA